MGLFDPKRRGNSESDYMDVDFEEYNVVDVETEEEEVAPETPVTAPARNNKAYSGTEIGAAASLELKVVRPEKYEDASDIADHLLAGRTVVLNMDFINKDVARRLIDFLSGVAYSIHGQFQRVATGTFIITPRNVEVSEAVKEEEDFDETDDFDEEYPLSNE